MSALEDFATATTETDPGNWVVSQDERPAGLMCAIQMHKGPWPLRVACGRSVFILADEEKARTFALGMMLAISLDEADA